MAEHFDTGEAWQNSTLKTNRREMGLMAQPSGEFEVFRKKAPGRCGRGSVIPIMPVV
jgi:hypothetical protein